MLIIFNWITANVTIQSVILHSILFNGSVHICKKTNKMALPWYWPPILDLEARRKAKVASKARRRKLRRLKQQQRMPWDSFWSSKHLPLFWPFLGLFCPIRVSCCAWCLTHVAPPLHFIKRSKVWFPQTTACPPFCSITYCNYFKKTPCGF